MRSSKTMYAVLIAGLALASCGGKPSDDNAAAADRGGTSAVAAGEVDPCSLMTADEMTAITTDKVNVVKPWGDRQSCRYSSDPSDDGVDIVVWKHDGVHQMEVMHNATGLVGAMGASIADKGRAGAGAAAILKPGQVPPPKLGDEAMWGPNTTLAVRKGTAYVEVSPPIMHDPANHPGYPIVPVEEKRKIAQAVAEKLLARLGA